MSIDEEIKRAVSNEVARQLPDAIRMMLSSLLQTDRREAPRLVATDDVAVKIPKEKRATKRAAKTCPIEGCESSFSPRFGGFCKDHRDTKAAKEWARSRHARK